MRALLRAAIAGRPVTEMVKSGYCLRRSSSARSIFSTTGRIWLESMSGSRPVTSTASPSLAMKRRTRCSGRILTYFCTVSMRSSPASLSQRRRLSSDQTLPRPACFSRTSCALAITSSGRGANRLSPVFHSIMMWTGLAPVSFWSMRSVAPSACSRSGTWSASR